MYSKLYYADRVRHVVEARTSETCPPTLKLRNEITREVFAKEPKEIQEAVEAAINAQKEEQSAISGCRASDSTDRSPEQYQR